MSQEHPKLRRLKVGLDGVKLLDPETNALTRSAAAANARAIEMARERLGRRFPAAMLSALNAYFAEPAVHLQGDDQTLAREWTTQKLLEEICARPQAVVFGKKSQGLQVNVIGQTITKDLGVQIEPESDLYCLDPEAIRSAAEVNASVEVRLFDRQCTSWTQVADDIAVVSGADIFMKLFVAGGEASVNGWHRDASDVVVTSLDGSKRFQVATAESADDAPVCEVDAVLRPGDALLLPRSRLHNATPTREVSALLSIGLMRHADWFYRGSSPTHLGLINPGQVRLYRLSLRPHISPTWAKPGEDLPCRSRMIGGIGIVSHEDGKVAFAAQGQTWEAEPDVVTVLASILGSDGISPAKLSHQVRRPAAWCVDAVNKLADFGLIRRG
jgi:hypothetical protein